MLGLLFEDDSKKQVYMNRYNKNSKALENLEDYELKYQIRDKEIENTTSKEPTIVTPSDIARLDMQQQLTTQELSLTQRFIKKLQEIKNKIFKNNER